MTTLSQHNRPDNGSAAASATPPPAQRPPGSGPQPGSDRALVGSFGLAITHAKWSLIETFRVPIAWIGGMLFPVLAFCFFALPIPTVRDDGAAAMQAIVSMMVFGFMANGLFSFGLELSSQRAKPWAPYLRTLPGRGGARMAGLIIATLVTALLSAIPVLVVGLAFTAASPEPGRLALGVATVVVTSVPAALVGLIIGTTCGEKAAIAVTQLVMFVMAFASGLFLPPMMFPEWLEIATRFLPVRAARELSLSAATGAPVEWWMLITFVVWTVALAIIGVVLIRRDEGQRYR